jgi:hypothetical protein
MRVLGCLIGLALLIFVPPLPADEPAPSKATTFEVPYRLTDVQHVLVRAKINGKGPFNFLVDTGAPALFVAAPLCKKLGIKEDRDGWGVFQRFEIEGGVVVPKARGRVETPFQLEGMNGLGLAGAELHGIIGYNILARYRIEYDFTRDKMTWTRLQFEPPAPLGLGKSEAPGGLDALGGIMKFLGTFLGKKAEPEVALRGFLGVVLTDGSEGVEVKAVLADSAAARAGIQAGDRITAFHGKTVRAPADVHRLAATLTAGQAAQVTLVRDDATKRLSVKLEEGF